jgi:hypothetical protein
MIDYKKRVRKIYPEANSDHPFFIIGYGGFYIWESLKYLKCLSYDTSEILAWKKAWERIEQITLEKFEE